MVKKLGIITIIDNDNYGNRLQNYAVQVTLKKLGIDNYTLLNTVTFNSRKRFFLKKIRYFGQDIYNTYSDNVNRKKAFQEFNSLINFDKKKYTIFSKFDYEWLLTGSDQVWNPYLGRLNDMDLLDIKNVNKIAFSASMGVSNISNNIDKNKIVNCLNDFKGISVRETSGKKILMSLGVKKEIEVFVDPTLLLSSEDWDVVSKKPSMLNSKKYILNYFLGDLSISRTKEIEKIAKENDCDIINILDKNSPYYECGPSEFLYLEKHAFLICTDSFHSSVFAIIYNRPFIIFDREEQNLVSMNSRLDTLISKLQLKDRKYNGKEITYENINHDYSNAYKQLNNEKQNALDFIKKTIRGVSNEN